MNPSGTLTCDQTTGKMRAMHTHTKVLNDILSAACPTRAVTLPLSGRRLYTFEIQLCCHTIAINAFRLGNGEYEIENYELFVTPS